MTKVPPADIYIAGTGNGAAVTALALSAAGFQIMLESVRRPPPPQNNRHNDWQRVLALSASAKVLLERLGVWARLDLPATPVMDMQVSGSPRSGGLAFAAPNDAATPHVLAHIVSLSALTRAIAAELTENANIGVSPAPFTDWQAETKTLSLAADAVTHAALLVDADSTVRPWRSAAGVYAMEYNYAASALVCGLTSTRAHEQIARQVFLPDAPHGILALLPLADAYNMALVWSLPKARATALARVDEAVFTQQLNAVCNTYFHDAGSDIGQLKPITARATQPLRLHLSSAYVAPRLALLGEAAHIIHPLAGQGFNLTLHDAAALADCLFDARMLGLDIGTLPVLQNYQTSRRAATSLMAGVTHGLAQLFSDAPRLGDFGLHLTSAMARHDERLAALSRNYADTALTPVPRLMRHADFTAPIY